jgi:ATP-dependent Lon protease
MPRNKRRVIKTINISDSEEEEKKYNSLEDDSDSDYQPSSGNDDDEVEDSKYDDFLEKVFGIKESIFDEKFLEELKESDKELYTNFMEVRDYLDNEVPKIEAILLSPFCIQDKARLLEIYELVSTSDPLSYEYLQLKDELKIKFTQARKKLTTSLECELKELETQFQQVSIEEQIINLNLPSQYKYFIYERYKKLQLMTSEHDEYGKLIEWISAVLKVPFGKVKELPPIDIISTFKQQLDIELYGMNNVKEQLMLYVNNRINNPHRKDYSLGLVGASGQGKTAIVIALSKVLQLPFYQLSAGVFNHSDGIHGHNYTYVGSEPGMIVKALTNTQYMNSIFFIDEFEKINYTKTFDSLLHLLDPVQNFNFRDRYIGDIPVDLSLVWFIMSMNTLPEQYALKDRLWIVKVEPYTNKEKLEILQNYLLPRYNEEYKIDVSMKDHDAMMLIEHSSGTEGLRPVILLLKDLLSKITFSIQHPNIKTSFKFKNLNVKNSNEIFLTSENIRDYLHNFSKIQEFSSMYI